MSDNLLFLRWKLHIITIFQSQILLRPARNRYLNILKRSFFCIEPASGKWCDQHIKSRTDRLHIPARVKVIGRHFLLGAFPDFVTGIGVLHNCQHDLRHKGDDAGQFASVVFRRTLNVINGVHNCVQNLAQTAQFSIRTAVQRNDIDIQAMLDVLVLTSAVDKSRINIHQLHDPMMIVLLFRRPAKLIVPVHDPVADNTPQLLIVRSGHKNIQIIVPRNKAFMAHHAKKGPACEPIPQIILFT